MFVGSNIKGTFNFEPFFLHYAPETTPYIQFIRSWLILTFHTIPDVAEKTPCALRARFSRIIAPMT